MYSGIFLQGVIYMEIQLWRSILCPYQLAVRELTVKFEHMIEEHKKNDLYSPIEQVSGRVKSVTSILEKKCSASISPWNGWKRKWRTLRESVSSVSLKRILIQWRL